MSRGSVSSIPPAEEREWQTRKKPIDTRLFALGWKAVPFDAARPLSRYDFDAIKDHPTASGPANYTVVVNGRLLGIVGASHMPLSGAGRIVYAQRHFCNR